MWKLFSTVTISKKQFNVKSAEFDRINSISLCFVT